MTLREPFALCCSQCGERLRREPSLTSPDVTHLICPEHGDLAYEWPLRITIDPENEDVA